MVEKKETKRDMPDTTSAEYWNERVPVVLPLNPGNPEDQTLFVSVNDYSAQIKRGEEVMVPRYVAEVIKQSQEADMAAFRKRMQMSAEYEEEARRH